MSPAIQTAIKVFNSKVRPALRKWKYGVALVENEPNHACWELRWGDLAAHVEVRYKKRTIMDEDAIITWESLLICGGNYCSINDRFGISSESLFKKFKDAVEAAVVFSCKREVERICHGSKGKLISRSWWDTKTVEWTAKDQLYRCTLTISLSKRQPRWCWVCERGKYTPNSSCPTSPLCEIIPEETVNPTEAFLKFFRAVVIDAFL
jgi:hypothetical protein